MVKLKVLDLFSGIGGFALGLESTGYFKTVQFVENEKWCQQILAKNFPGVPIHDDIKTYNTYQGVEADVVVGGFPCQPFSVAGKGKAVQDDRHLWPEMFRVIRQTKPTWVIGENVRNIVSISDGMVLEQVYLDLESQGYEVQSFIIPASAVNAPHQRYRTWIVAYSNNNGHQRGCIKTRNEVDARENTSSIGRVNTENIGRSNNDGGNQTRSVTNGSIQGSRNNNQTTAANTTGVCEVSEREYIHQGIDTQNRHQENHDRTLVQNRQQGVQSSINRGLEQNQTTFENIKIRQRNDDGAISGVDTAYVENTRRSSWREQPTRNTESIRRRSSEKTKWSTHTDQTARSSQRTETVADTDSKGLQRQREITSRTYEELKNFGNPCWWNTEPDVGRMVDGLPNRVDRLKGLGNAIVPQIAYQIGMAIKEAENDS
tara:strand:- start:36 stop:1325 length:1290 start_codon:yes stop_codon:yes gene_type:complete